MSKTAENRAERVFDDRRSGRSGHVVLPWRRTVEICWANVLRRMGRSLLTFVCVAVVVAFFMSALTYQNLIESLTRLSEHTTETGIHTRAVLERAGVFTHDPESQRRHRDQRIWLMALSGFLCLVGITNTILMSVTERFREIGTLKCLGAVDSFIVRLFLIESVFIGLTASCVGAVIGYVLALLQLGAVFEFGLLSADNCGRALVRSMPLAVGLGAVLTVLAALYPTYVAARMRPVDAMRTEV